MTDAEFDAAVDRDAANQPPHPDDVNIVCVWADGTQCNQDDLAEYLTFMSDDYELITLSECPNEDVNPGWCVGCNPDTCSGCIPF